MKKLPTTSKRPFPSALNRKFHVHRRNYQQYMRIISNKCHRSDFFFQKSSLRGLVSKNVFLERLFFFEAEGWEDEKQIKMVRVLSCLRELTDKFSMISSVTIGRKSKSKRATVLQLRYHSFHPIYGSEVHLAARLCVSQPLGRFRGQLPIARCVLPCQKGDLPRTQSRGAGKKGLCGARQ